MKKNSGYLIHSGAYTSPGTPDYADNNVGEIPKYWSSERVPLPTNSTTSISRRHISAAALMPFNSGRTLPSKWDDAERWITSPVSTHGSVNSPITQTQRRPKSKSGPLGPPGFVYSPTKPAIEGGNVKNFMVNSPLATGVWVPEGLSIHYDGGKSNSFYVKHNVKPTTSETDLVIETPGPSSQDDKLDGVEEEAARVVYRRDMATQMSPEGTTHSSSKGSLSFSALPSSVPNSSQPNINPAAKDEVRDVQVDKGATTAGPSKKQEPKKMKKGLSNVEDSPVPWNASEATKNISKLEREEAKITAWENLQKAKAEAAIRKLEMKLEKKRSASMDKIMNRLRAAQMKAQAMRDLHSENHSNQASRTSRLRFSCCTYVKTSSVSNCFLCRRN